MRLILAGMIIGGLVVLVALEIIVCLRADSQDAEQWEHDITDSLELYGDDDIIEKMRKARDE